ncbi:antitermination protein [Escherichia coli]|nr:antitermination protein [Escherichia coli]
MRLESVAKFHSPKSPMMSDSPRATASDSLSGTDVMAAMGMAQSQAGFGMAAFCGKHELSQNDKQKAINYLMQFAHKVSGKYRGVAKLEGNTKAKVSPLWLSASSSACHGLLIITVKTPSTTKSSAIRPHPQLLTCRSVNVM